MITDHGYSVMLLDEPLTYQVRGVLIEVSRRYGSGHKERVYQEACREAFVRTGIQFAVQPRVAVHSVDTGRTLATHIPDFVIAERIVVELKAVPWLPPAAATQLEQYLRVTTFEIGFLVNFGTPKAQIVRRIFTNDRKPWMVELTKAGLHEPHP